MITILPVEPNLEHFAFSTTIETVEYRFRFDWNDVDGAFYMRVAEADGTLIAAGIKVVLGVWLGRRYAHDLFLNGGFVAVDTSGQGREATLADLGSRVELRYYSTDAIVGEILG